MLTQVAHPRERVESTLTGAEDPELGLDALGSGEGEGARRRRGQRRSGGVNVVSNRGKMVLLG